MANKNNPFCARKPRKTSRSYDKEYIHYKIVEEVADPESFDPKKPSEFLVKKKTVEYERLPIDETINQFASKVGLKNELKGVVSKQQMDEFIQVHQAKPGFTDLTVLPDSAFDIKKLADQVDKAWAAVPEELKGSLTKEEFMKTITSDKIKSFIDAKVSSQTKKGDNE